MRTLFQVLYIHTFVHAHIIYIYVYIYIHMRKYRQYTKKGASRYLHIGDANARCSERHVVRDGEDHRVGGSFACRLAKEEALQELPVKNNDKNDENE